MDFEATLLRPFVAFAVLAAVSPAQEWATIPSGFDRLPGNAAVSVPGRWTWGRLQVLYDAALFTDLVGESITGLRIRRPAFFDEPAYVGSTMTFEISLGPSPRDPANMSGNFNDQYDPASPMQVVYAQQSYAIPPTPAPGQADVVGESLVDLTFDQPFVVPAGTSILLEWRTIDTSLTVLGDGWADCVWLPSGQDVGLARHAGQNGCGNHGAMRLDVAPGSEHPALGQTTNFRLEGAQHESSCHFAIGFEPVANTPGGFGVDVTVFPFAGLCQLWTPLQFFLAPVQTDAAGAVDFGFEFPSSNTLQGIQVGMQAFVVETDDQDLPTAIAASNGVVLLMDSIGLGDMAATALFPADDATAPWIPWVGLCPIIEFSY
ncbi:MAG: hypothetical protein KDB80_01315 [Planctomycetes bacterium]|nr:hypothetical protein [Planctomycetota bacterium]